MVGIISFIRGWGKNILHLSDGELEDRVQEEEETAFSQEQSGL